MILSIIWGLVILGVLILRVRNVLHTGLMEAALERSAREGGVGESGELQFCSQCEMPLLDHAAFCNNCGTAVRVQPEGREVQGGGDGRSSRRSRSPGLLRTLPTRRQTRHPGGPGTARGGHHDGRSGDGPVLRP